MGSNVTRITTPSSVLVCKERFTVDLGFLFSLLGKPGLMKWLTAELRGKAATSHSSQAARRCTLP